MVGIRTAMVFAYPVVVMVSWPWGGAVLTAGLASILAVIDLGCEHLGRPALPPWIPASLVIA